ncbi:MAG: YwbE family protein [Methanobacterium sp.]
MDGKHRKNISRGSEVYIVLKKDQKSGKITHGFVKEILTNSKFHPHGIKVRLSDGKIGRVKSVIK